jgi:hypothetical protein
MGEVGFQLDAERVEQRRRPALLEAQPAPVAANAENAQRNDRAGQYQQKKPEQPEGAATGGGLVQSACPR